MAASPRELQTKRSLDANEVLSEGQLKEKRPRLESENSEIVEDVTDREELEMDISDVTSGREEAHDDVSTELIYKLSPENDESLCPSKSEENNENREERLKKESDNEEGEEANSEEEHSESDHDSGSEDDEEGDSEGNEGNEELKDAMEVKESGRSNEETTRPSVENMSDEDSEESGGEQDHGTGLAEEHDDSSAEETVSNVGKENTELVQEEEDTSDNSEEEEGVREYNKVSEMKAVELVPVSSDDEEREIKMPQELHKKKDVAEHESVTSDDEHSPNHKKSNKAQKEPTGKHTAETVGEKKRSEERKQGEKDAPDGGEMFGRTDDYSKRSVEDLEDLQEDIHKELAQINEKSEQRKKHKKTGSSGHREKRHKEKSVSRHKDKTRDKERERQRSSENRGDSRKDHEKSYERGRKHYEHFDHEDKHWSHDSRRSRSQKEEHRHRNEKLIWSQSRPERAPSRAESNKSGNSRREVKESKVYKAEKNPNEARATASQDQSGKNDEKKGFISDSMREMIRESMKERKGLSLEVVEEESDDSGGEQLLDGKASDVSSASSSSEDEQEAESSPEVPKLPPYLPAVQGCRNVEEFQWLNRIEEGTYGVVYRAKDKRSGEIVALKKLKMEKEKEGFPITSLREINTLLKAQHPNIVTVQEIVVGSNMDKIYIVMDFVEHDLKALMETMTQAFLAGEIKTIMIQLLRAVSHLHDNWILHRDIKTSNLLLSNKGILKVGDFGLAREYGSPLKPYTPIVVTLWYRAPELLLGAKEYATPIDLWSVGCVFAELLTMKPLFNGQSEISQINKIFKELGTPSDKIWPGPPAYSEYPATKKMTFAEYPYNNLRNRFGATLTDNGFDLLNSFLTYDPKRRISADEALKHEYFQELPRPVEPSMFPSWPARSEGAKRAKKASPKAPEGGNFYKTLSGDGDKAFHMPAGKSQGSSAVPGFTLKF